MADFRKLKPGEIEALGISLSVKVDSLSGEVRARLSAPGGADVSITAVPHDAPGGWQNSHSHERVVEVTTIVSGAVVQVEYDGVGELRFTRILAGKTFSTHPGRPHSLLVFPGTVMSTLKMYDMIDGKRDWIADEGLDKYLAKISVEDALARCH